MIPSRMAAGALFPAMSWNGAAGDRVDPASRPGWRLVIVYRGKHCPLCKAQLDTLDGMVEEFKAAGVEVFAVSADPREKAEAQVKENGWTFPVGYDLSIEQMRELGLYVSDPRSPQETDRPFAEPGMYVINPQGRVQIVAVSNAPFARPDLKDVLEGIKFVSSKDYPIRGRA